MAIGELAVNVTARTANARKAVKSFGTDVKGLRKPVNVAALTVKRLDANTKRLGATLVGFVGFRAVKRGIDDSMASIDGLAKTSRKLGITTENLAGIRLAAEESGVAVNTLDMSLQRMVRRVSEASKGKGEAVSAISELGINAVDLAAQSPDEQLKQVADAMQRVESQGDKVRLAMKLFDSEGVALVNTLAGGRKAMDDATASAKRLGLAVSDTDAAKVEAANDAYGRMGKAITGLNNQLAVGLAPAIESMAVSTTDWLTSGSAATNGIAAGTEKVTRGLGIAVDVVDTFKIGFLGVQSFATRSFANIAEGVDQSQEAIVSLVNMIPGMAVETSSLISSMADELDAAADRTEKSFNKAFLADPPSKQFNKFFDDANKKSEQVGINMRKAVSPNPALANGIGSLARGMGGLLAQGSNKSSSMIRGAVDMASGGLGGSLSRTSGEVGINTALDANSAQGHAALSANMRGTGNDDMKKATVDSSITLKQVLAELQKQTSQFTGNAPQPLPQG